MRKILLRGARGKDKFALVDDEDFDRVNQYKWWYSVRNYAIAHIQSHTLTTMHRFILNPPKKKSVDHINGNTLDNQKINLRFCTQKENTRNGKKRITNTSGYTGVIRLETCKKNGKIYIRKKQWVAQIKVDYKRIFLGYFLTPIEAAKAYDIAAIKYFGEYARLNFPKA